MAGYGYVTFIGYYSKFKGDKWQIYGKLNPEAEITGKSRKDYEFLLFEHYDKEEHLKLLSKLKQHAFERRHKYKSKKTVKNKRLV